MRRFKVGDKLKIISEDKMLRLMGDYQFHDGRILYCEKEVIITELYSTSIRPPRNPSLSAKVFYYYEVEYTKNNNFNFPHDIFDWPEVMLENNNIQLEFEL